MDRDGTKDGYDLELTRGGGRRRRRAGDRLGRGRGGSSTSRRASRAGADAVLAASIFHYEHHSIGEARDALRAAGVDVRPI